MNNCGGAIVKQLPVYMILKWKRFYSGVIIPPWKWSNYSGVKLLLFWNWISALGSYSRTVKLYQNNYNGSYYRMAVLVNFPRVAQAKGWIAPGCIICNYVIDCCRVRGVLKENGYYLRPFLILLLQNIKSYIIKSCSVVSFDKNSECVPEQDVKLL